MVKNFYVKMNKPIIKSVVAQQFLTLILKNKPKRKEKQFKKKK